MSRQLAKQHAELLAALKVSQGMLIAFGGDLTKVPKSEADAGHVDAVMWMVQTQNAAVISKAEEKS